MADDRLNNCARPPARCRRKDRQTGADVQTDALGNPVRLLFRPGQRNDITKAHALIEGFEAEAVIADKGHDANHSRQAVLAREGAPVIPSKSNRRAPIEYDKALYKERNLVERFFNKLKQFRASRPATTSSSPTTEASSCSQLSQ